MSPSAADADAVRADVAFCRRRRRELARLRRRRAASDRRPHGARVFRASRHLWPHARATTPRRSGRSPPSAPPAIAGAYDRATDASWAARGRWSCKARGVSAGLRLPIAGGGAESLETPRRSAGCRRRRAGAARSTRSVTGCSRLPRPDRTNVARAHRAVADLAARGDFEGAADMAHRSAADCARRTTRRRAAGLGVRRRRRRRAPGSARRCAGRALSVPRRVPLLPATALFLHGQTAGGARRRRARWSPRIRSRARRRTCSAPRAPRSASASVRNRPSKHRSARIRAIRSTYVNLGTFYLQAANPAAADMFAEALTIDPTSAPPATVSRRRAKPQNRSPSFKIPYRASTPIVLRSYSGRYSVLTPT